jgi:hypothetical protein
MSLFILFVWIANLEQTTTALVKVSDFIIKLSRMGKIFATMGLSFICPQERHIEFTPMDFKFSHDFAPPQNKHMNKGFCLFCSTTCFTAYCIFSIDFSSTFETINLYVFYYVPDRKYVEFKINSLMIR